MVRKSPILAVSYPSSSWGPHERSMFDTAVFWIQSLRETTCMVTAGSSHSYQEMSRPPNWWKLCSQLSVCCFESGLWTVFRAWHQLDPKFAFFCVEQGKEVFGNDPPRPRPSLYRLRRTYLPVNTSCSVPLLYWVCSFGSVPSMHHQPAGPSNIVFGAPWRLWLVTFSPLNM